jgi:DNA polymerase-1
LTDVLIADANNIAARCWQARAVGASEEPPPLEVAQTALGMIEKQAEAMRIAPEHTVLAFDAGDSHRTAAFAGYKADRSARAEGLERTLELLDDLASRRGLARCAVPPWEADDVIATLARRYRVARWGVAIYSNDGDLLQLLGEGVMVIQPLAKGQVREWTRESFAAEYGFVPALLPHYKALRGDKSDGLPQVPGLGEAWGKRLIAAHGDIDRLYEALHAAPPDSLSALQRAILDCEDQVRLNLVIATLQEVPGL